MSASLYFGPEPDGWDVNDTGRPGVMLFGNAVQVWCAMQIGKRGGVCTVAQAAEAFCCDEAMIREAVEEHPWMDVFGDEIVHEGE